VRSTNHCYSLAIVDRHHATIPSRLAAVARRVAMVGSRLAVTARRVATIPRHVAITAWPHAMILWLHLAIARRLSIVATRLAMIDRRLADTKYGFFAIKRASWPNSPNPAMARQDQISEGEEVADR